MQDLLKALSVTLNLVDQGVLLLKDDNVLFNSIVREDLSFKESNIQDSSTLCSLKSDAFCNLFFEVNSIKNFLSDVSSSFCGTKSYRTKKNQLIDIKFQSGGCYRICLLRNTSKDETISQLKQAAADYAPYIITGVEFFEDEGYYVPHYTNTAYNNWTNSESIIGLRFPPQAGAFKDATTEFAKKYKNLDENNPKDFRYGPRGMDGTTRQIATTIHFAGRSCSNNKLFVNFTEDLELTNKKGLDLEYRHALMVSLFEHSSACIGILELREDPEKICFIECSRPDWVEYNSENRAALATAMIKSRKTKESTSIQLENKLERWSQFSLSHYKDDMFFYIAVDITETKKLMIQLYQAKSQFLGTMSHEIRTPLTGIIGALNLLSMVEMSSEDLEVVRIGKVCSSQLLVVINDILDFSKMEDNKMLIESIMFSVHQPIRDALEIVSVDAEKKKIELIYDVQNKLKDKFSETFEPPAGYELLNTFGTSTTNTIIGDPTRLRQIIINLLSNAVKFSTIGPIVIKATAFMKREDNQSNYLVHFSVEDQGTGISEENLDKLFQPFSQVDASVTRRFGGSGLGLSISKRLSELMGGRIWCVSKIGVGSVFHFTIATTQISEPMSPTSPISAKRLRTSYPFLKVLIAEDNLLNQKILLRILKTVEISNVTIVNNGIEAFHSVQLYSYDIVFMDVNMPLMGGIDATKKIRLEIDPMRQPTIIGLTADAFKENEDNCYNAGMNGFLTKPIIADELCKTINKYCQ